MIVSDVKMENEYPHINPNYQGEEDGPDEEFGVAHIEREIQQQRDLGRMLRQEIQQASSHHSRLINNRHQNSLERREAAEEYNFIRPSYAENEG